MKKKKLSKNFIFLNRSINQQNYSKDQNGNEVLTSGLRGAVLEGGSRSAKTTDSVDTIIKLCVQASKPLVIFVIKETQVSFKTSLYSDFNNRLKHYGLPSAFDDAKEVSVFKINGSKIHFMGADKVSKFEGAGCDYAYFNEALNVPQEIFDQVEMRCRFFWWMDYNPRVTLHWIYDKVIPRNDVGFLRTTWKDNAYLPAGMRAKILSYSPYAEGQNITVENNELYFNGSIIDENNKPKPHLQNIENGTADDTNYKVFYHGIRCAPEGIIIKNYRFIDEFPELDYIYANDFGFTNDPNALVKYAETEAEIFVELLIYQPIDNAPDLIKAFEAVGVEKEKPVICDSSDKFKGDKGSVEMVQMLINSGQKAFKVSKTRTVIYWLGSLKSKRINIINNNLSKKAKLELENYVYKSIHGIQLNEPVDKMNHFIDATRYGHIAWTLSGK